MCKMFFNFANDNLHNERRKTNDEVRKMKEEHFFQDLLGKADCPLPPHPPGLVGGGGALGAPSAARGAAAGRRPRRHGR